MPKIYFFDLGIRNAILGNFLEMESRQDSGHLFENFVFLELKNQRKEKIFFYRSVSKAEIDFILKEGAEIILMEVKYKKLARPIRTQALENFIQREENVKKALVINLGLNCKDNFIQYADYRRV